MSAPTEHLRLPAERPSYASRPRVPKLCGADIELGTFIVDHHQSRSEIMGDADRAWRASLYGSGLASRNRSNGRDDEAARAVLAEIPGIPAWRARPSSQFSGLRTGAHVGWAFDRSNDAREDDPQDRARKFLPANGGCAYIDLDHLELCLPEVTNAYDHVAAWHAMLRIAREAQVRANARQPAGRSIHLLANSSDGHSHSYGAHLNFLVARRAWDDLFHRRLHHLLWLASYQISSIVYTGAGKVGGENGVDDVPYQLSQRADFFESLVGPQTTVARPIVNSRDEPLCGRGYTSRHQSVDDAPATARLHVIFFDSTLCHVSSMLKVGVMQIVLAMLEAGCADLSMAVEDPIEALRRWSRDLTLCARTPMLRGEPLSAIELQTRFLEQASDFVSSGACDGIVPRAAEILACWADTLDALRRRDVGRLSARLDWALKLEMLGVAMRQQPSLTWDSPQLKHLDHLYSSLDPQTGLYWACERAGRVERIVDEARIDVLVHDPPDDTRAWTRAHLLRRLGANGVEEVDWDVVRCDVECELRWNRTRRIHLDDPTALGRAEAEPLFHAARSDDELFDALERTGET